MTKQLRTQEEFVSQLPEYRVKVSKDFPDFLLVWCPKENCPGTTHDRPFLVHKRTWLRPVKLIARKHNGVEYMYHVVGRACPYCMRTAKIPRRITSG